MKDLSAITRNTAGEFVHVANFHNHVVITVANVDSVHSVSIPYEIVKDFVMRMEVKDYENATKDE